LAQAAVDGSQPWLLPILTRVNRENVCRNFATLWTHSNLERESSVEKNGRPISRRHSAIGELASSSGGQKTVLARPLLLLLDSLAEEGTELFVFVKLWLQDLPTLNKVFDLLLTSLQSLQVMRVHESNLGTGSHLARRHTSAIDDDTSQCLYLFKHILNILKWSTEYTWFTLSDEVLPALEGQNVDGPMSPMQVILAQLCMRVLRSASTQSDNKRAFLDIVELRRVALSVLQHLLGTP
jgi:hypothetical protein